MRYANSVDPHTSESHVKRLALRMPAIMRAALIVTLYVVGWLALEAATISFEISPGITPWFPPPALSLALVLIFGPRYTPALLIGPIVSGIWLDPIPISRLYLFVFALINATGYGSAAIFLQRVARIDPHLRRLRDVAWFVGVGTVAAPLIVALLSAADFVAAGLVNPSDYSSVALDIWVGDMIGVLILTPFLLLHIAPWVARSAWKAQTDDEALGARPMLRGRAIVEALAQAASIALAPWVIFGMKIPDAFYFLPVIWIALRSGLPGATAAILALNVEVMFAIRLWQIPVSDPTELQLFMIALSFTGLFVGAIASARKRAEDRLRRQNEYMEALHDTTLHLVKRLDLDDLLETIVLRAGALVGTSDGFIYLVDTEADELVIRVGVGIFNARIGSRLKSNEGLAGRIWRTGQPMAVDEYATWPGRVPGVDVQMFHALVGIPLTSRAQVVGVIGLAYSEAGRRFSAEAIAVLSRFAQLASLALDNARLYSGAQRRLAELTTVQNIAWAINSRLRLDEVFRTVVTQISTAFGYQLVSIYLREGAGLALQASIGYEKVMPFILLDQSVSGRVVQTGQAAFVRDVAEDPDFVGVAPDTRQAIIIPLKPGDGQVLGTLLVESTGTPVLAEDDFRLLQLLADQISVAVANARLFADLRASEQRNRSLLEQAADSIFVISPLGYILDANEQATALLGYTRDELLRMRLGDCVAPMDIARAQTLVAIPRRDGRASATLRLRKRDGTLIPVEVNAGAIDDGIVLAIVRDVSERQRLENQLRQAQKLEAIGTLANGIAHDFNNLLAAITGYAELSIADTPPTDPRHADLEQIARAAQRGIGLTRQLLAFSRPAAPERRPLDLTLLVQEAFHLLRPTIPATITIQTESATDLWPVEADPAQLQQILVNLVVNARDALPQGGTICITTANVLLDSVFSERPLGVPQGRYVRLSVTDSGIGMDERTISRIFEPFFTTKEPGKGTGLGLAVTHGIVRGHGGVIDVISRLGQGTTMAIYLPASGAETTAAPDRDISAPRGHGELILVVDDEPAVRKLGQRILERYGYRALTAEDGEVALALFRTRHAEIAAVILDLTMPAMDGRATFAALRALDSRVPVIFSSGQSPAELTAQLAAPDTMFIAKPYNLVELTRAVANTLQTAKKTI